MIHSLNKYSLRPKDIVQFTIFLRPIYIVELVLGHVRTLACAVVERQGTSIVVREKALSSHLLLVHVGKFVSVSAAAAFHDLDKALRDKNTFFNLSWPVALRNPRRLRSAHRCCLAPTGAEVTGSIGKIRDRKKVYLSLINLVCLNTSWTTVLERREDVYVVVFGSVKVEVRN
jgi:hypothetical protein